MNKYVLACILSLPLIFVSLVMPDLPLGNIHVITLFLCVAGWTNALVFN